MRSIIVILAIQLTASLNVRGQTIDELAATVVYLAREMPETVTIDGAVFEIGVRPVGAQSSFVPRLKRVSGTGFLVARDERLALVTAKHVALTLNPQALVTLGVNRTPLTVTLADFSGWQRELRWRFHPTADVAVLGLTPIVPLRPLLRGHFLPEGALQREPPSRDVTLTVLGFPLSIGIEGGFAPVARETKLGGGPLQIAGAGSVFLMQDPSVGGFSGSPVFDAQLVRTIGAAQSFEQRTPTCIGVVSATIADDTGGKFAVVVPASVVADLLLEVWGPRS